MAENVKQLLADNKKSMNQQMLLEYYDDTLKELISEKKGNKRQPIHAKLDKMIDVFDDTRKSFDNNTKIMMSAFGQSVALTKKMLGDFSASNFISEEQVSATSIMAKNSSDALNLFKKMEYSLSSINTLIYDYIEQLKIKEASQIKDGPKKDEKDKKPFDFKFGMGALSGIIGAKAMGAISGLIGFIGKFGGVALKATRFLGRAIPIIGGISAFFNAITTFGNDEEVAKIAGKPKEAITAVDRWVSAIAAGLSAFTFDIIKAEDLFKPLKAGQEMLSKGIDALFDPETGIFGRTTTAFMNLLDNFNLDNTLMLVQTSLEDTVGAVATGLDALWLGLQDLFSMENIQKAWDNVKSAVTETVMNMFSFLPESLKKTITGVLPMAGDALSAAGSMGKSALDAIGNLSMDDVKGAFNRFMQPTVNPIASVNKNINDRQQVLAAKLDKKPYMVTKEKADNEAKFKQQLENQAPSPVVINNNSNTTVASPVRYDILDSGTRYAMGGY